MCCRTERPLGRSPTASAPSATILHLISRYFRDSVGELRVNISYDLCMPPSCSCGRAVAVWPEHFAPPKHTRSETALTGRSMVGQY